MTNRSPTLPKWPFIFADVALLAVSAWVITQVLPHRTTVAYVVTAVAIIAWIVGAILCVWPWIVEFKAQAQQLQNDSLADALKQIERLEEVGTRVQTASANWQSVQDASARVVQSAKEIEERIKIDSKDFMEFAERINADEKQHLRLEVEKLRRTEAEWLQVSARMLDHTFALTAAALRSGQPNLATQMTNFQNACRDAARRVGLVPFHPAPGDPFEDRSQQLEDPNAKAPDGAIVSDILATGFTFQGQLLRKALVRLGNGGVERATPTDTAELPREVDATEEEATPSSAEPEATQEGPIEPNEPVAAAPEPVVQEIAAPEPEKEEPRPEPAVFKEAISAEESAAMANLAQREEASQSELEAGTTAEPPVEIQEPVAEAGEVEKPRRRRKTDPQTSLPF